MVLSQCTEQRTGKVLCKVNVKCNVKTAKTRFFKVLATCNRRRIPLGKSHDVNIIEGGFCKVLVAYKVTTGKEFHMVQAAWNVKASKRGFHKLQATCNVNKARAGNCKRKATYITKKNRGIWKGTSQIIELKVTKNVVGNGCLKIFCSVKWLQYLLEGLESSSDKVAPESMSSV